MSYDVYLEEPECPTCHRSGGQPFNGNMTSNVSGIWFRALNAALGKTVPADWGSVGGAPHPLAETIDPKGAQWTDQLGAFGPLANMTGGDAIPVLDRAADHIVNNPDVYAKFQPDNGWGTAEGAARFLRQIAAAWRETPTAVLRVSR